MASDLMQLRILRRPEVEHVTGLSRASLYRLIGQKEFPAPVRLTTGNAVGWRESAIREWLESREPVGPPTSVRPEEPPEGRAEGSSAAEAGR